MSRPSPRPLKTVRLRTSWNSAKMDRRINREVAKNEKRGYVFVGHHFVPGSVFLTFTVPNRTTGRVMR